MTDARASRRKNFDADDACQHCVRTACARVAQAPQRQGGQGGLETLVISALERAA
jgi:hypothetical protein